MISRKWSRHKIYMWNRLWCSIKIVISNMNHRKSYMSKALQQFSPTHPLKYLDSANANLSRQNLTERNFNQLIWQMLITIKSIVTWSLRPRLTSWLKIILIYLTLFQKEDRLNSRTVWDYWNNFMMLAYPSVGHGHIFFFSWLSFGLFSPCLSSI